MDVTFREMRPGLFSRIWAAIAGKPASQTVTGPEKCITPDCPSIGNVEHGECDECYFSRQL
jgi:hypothetical protein